MGLKKFGRKKIKAIFNFIVVFTKENIIGDCG